MLVLTVSAAVAAPPVITTVIDRQGDQKLPVLVGDILVYEDHAGGNATIFMHNFSTGENKRISSINNRQYAPHTDGSYVVWVDSTFAVQSIYLYNITTGEAARITNVGSEKRNPKVHYPWVVWSDFRNNMWEVMSYNISTRETRRVASHNYTALRSEFDAAGNRRAHHDGQLAITIWNDRIVWTDFRNQNWDLYGANLRTGEIFPVVVAPRNQTEPHLVGDRLVYRDDRGDRMAIYLYDFSTGGNRLVNAAHGDRQFPQISGNMIIWQDFRGERWDLYGYDLNTSTEVILTSNPNQQTRPSISGNRVVFMNNRIGREDIAMINIVNEAVNIPTTTPDLGNVSGINIMVNGRLLPTDVSPIMEQGRVLVPVRIVGEALGANVDWNQDLQHITLTGEEQNVELFIGNRAAVINGVSEMLDVPAQIIQGRTLVPLRFVSQAFGAEVNWNSDLQLVEISF